MTRFVAELRKNADIAELKRLLKGHEHYFDNNKIYVFCENHMEQNVKAILNCFTF